MLRCLSICSKSVKVHLLQEEWRKERRREPGRDVALILRAGFEQLCLMKVGESETLHAGAWLGGEQSADARGDARMQSWMPLGRRVRVLTPKLLWGVYETPTREWASQGILSLRLGIALQPFSHHDTPGWKMSLLKDGDECLGGSRGRPSGKHSIFGASHYVELMHCTVLCLGTQVGKI